MHIKYLVTLIALVAVLSGCESPVESHFPSREETLLNPYYTFHLAWPDGSKGKMPLFLSPDDANGCFAAVNVNSNNLKICQDATIASLPVGAKIRVLQINGKFVFIQVLDGASSGIKGYVQEALIYPKAAKTKV